MPDTREALIEAMARGTVAQMVEPAYRDQYWSRLGDAERAAFRVAAEEALAAIEAAGCVVVPKEATEAMIREIEDPPSGLDKFTVKYVYEAMLAASPFAKREGA